MNIGLILAGGIGRRMGITSMPKQYMDLGKKPIIIHTIEQFLINPNICEVVVLVPSDWIAYTQELLEEYVEINNKDVIVLEGGNERFHTLQIGCEYVLNKHTASAKIISHDAVRPFISQKIINENIIKLNKYKVIDTIIPSNDTIVRVSEDNTFLVDVPDRSKMYLGQTPQSFYVEDYLSILGKTSESELRTTTDACKLFVDNKFKVGFVSGSQTNFKITTMFDLKLANILIASGVQND